MVIFLQQVFMEIILGKWVDENTKLRPRNFRGKLRQKSEIQHLKLFKLHKIPTHIFSYQVFMVLEDQFLKDYNLRKRFK